VLRLRRKKVFTERDSNNTPFVSVIVPARNEESVISSCLDSLIQQDYPENKYEIIVINDRSTDRTPTIIKGYSEKYNRIRCIHINSNNSGLTGKQNALNEGLKFCEGEIILNIDADCIAKPFWIRRTVSHFTPEIGLTVGFSTTYSANGSNSFFSDLQSLDMLFLMDAAAGAIGMKRAFSCLGRNLAHRKAVINEVNYTNMGYNITEDAAFIQSVSRNTKWGISVVYDKDAAVSTVSEKGLRQLLSQRIRWIVGGQTTRSWSLIPLNAIFLFHLYLILCLPILIFVHSLSNIAMLSISTKMILDFIRCWRVCRKFDNLRLLRVFIPFEIFIITYTILAGIGGAFTRKIKWKDDLYAKNARHKNYIRTHNRQEVLNGNKQSCNPCGRTGDKIITRHQVTAKGDAASGEKTHHTIRGGRTGSRRGE
jgi:cellulose synthase/poly-beta-1,6-N-acetylglucosamine synthase-like glycosyltransferase